METEPDYGSTLDAPRDRTAFDVTIEHARTIDDQAKTIFARLNGLTQRLVGPTDEEGKDGAGPKAIPRGLLGELDDVHNNIEDKHLHINMLIDRLQSAI